jgi:hypothetical protein|uniref:Uncharacterized protein n=1 Tax=Zea mays TaxID=4577 RepID=A0A804RI20_MAIZE
MLLTPKKTHWYDLVAIYILPPPPPAPFAILHDQNPSLLSSTPSHTHLPSRSAPFLSVSSLSVVAHGVLLVLARPCPRAVAAKLPGFELERRAGAAVEGPAAAAGRRILQQLPRVPAEAGGAAVRPVPAARLRRPREPAAEAAVKA